MVQIAATKKQTVEDFKEHGVLPVDSLSNKQTAIDPVVSQDTGVFVPPTPEFTTQKEQQTSAAIKRVQDLQTQTLGQDELRAQAQQEQDIAGKEQTLQDITDRLGVLSAEADQIPLQLQEESTGRGRTAGGLAPLQTARLRTNAIAQLGANASFQAAKGNLALAQDLVDRAVSAEFDPIFERLEVEQANLALMMQLPDLTASEKREAEAVTAMILEEQAQAEEAKAEKQAVFEIMGIAAQANVDATVLKAIQNATTREEALQIAAQAGVFEEDTTIDPLTGAKIESEKALALQRLASADKTRKEMEAVGLNAEGHYGLEALDQLKARSLSVDIFGKRAGTKPENIQLVEQLVAQGMDVDTIKDTLRYSGQSEEFQGTLRDAAESISTNLSENKKQTFFDTLDRSLEEGDIKRAKEVLSKVAIDSLGVDESKQVRGKMRTIEFLQEIATDLKTFEDKGGNTGIFEGTTEKMLNKVGKTKDPELAEIASKIAIAIQQYRRSMSGVAFSVPESKEYGAIFPSIDKVSELNTARLGAVNEVFNEDVKFILGNRMGEEAYQDLFGDNPTNEETLSDEDAYEEYLKIRK